jgi:type VI secretion system secreted protein Hcp
MAFDCFLQIDGIEGESTDDKHSGWIEVATYTHGVTQKASATTSSAGGAGSERSDFGDFVFTKLLDKSSPKILIACAAGTHIDKVVVEICRAGSEKVRYMAYELTNCIISGYSAAGGGDIPAERFSINFGKVMATYTQQKRDGGGPAGNIAGGWDRQRNCRV